MDLSRPFWGKEKKTAVEDLIMTEFFFSKHITPVKAGVLLGLQRVGATVKRGV